MNTDPNEIDWNSYQEAEAIVSGEKPATERERELAAKWLGLSADELVNMGRLLENQQQQMAVLDHMIEIKERYEALGQ